MKNYAAFTVSSYISALSYPHRLGSLPDPATSEMIRKLALRGYSKLNPSKDSRLLISLPILENIILACEHTKSSQYIAFFAALRVGEICYRGKQPGQNIISISQILFQKTREGAVTALALTLRKYKHSDPLSPVYIFIYREGPVCPVYLLSEYINTRGQFPGPLFCWPDASSISRSFFVTALKEDLQFCDLDNRITIITLIAIGSVPLSGQLLKVCRTHRSGILDAGNLMHFSDIFEPPQWGRRQPSKRNVVLFAHTCSCILVLT